MPSSTPNAAPNSIPSSMGAAAHGPHKSDSNPSQPTDCIVACQECPAPQLTSPGIPGTSDSTAARPRSTRRGKPRTKGSVQEADPNGGGTTTSVSQPLHTQSAAKISKTYQKGDASQAEGVKLPFQPGYLSSCFESSSPPLPEAVIDFTIKHIVACNTETRTVPSCAWFPGGSCRAIQPHDEETVFILPVNVDRGHWVCVVIRVGERDASLFDSFSGGEDAQPESMCKELASQFISKCLPEPLNNWDEGWHIARSHHNSQRYNCDDSGIYCIGVALHIALGWEVPVSLDSQLLRAFCQALCRNMNHLATTSAASTPAPGDSHDGSATVPVDENQHGAAQDVTSQLMDTLPTQWVPKYQNQIPEQLLSKPEGESAGGKTIEEFVRRQREVIEAVNSSFDVKISELRSRKVAVGHFVRLAQAVCDLDQRVLATPNRAKHGKRLTVLKEMRAQLENEGRSDVTGTMEQTLALLDFYQNRHKESAMLLKRLQLAVAQAQVGAVAAHMDRVAEDYRKHPLLVLEVCESGWVI